MQRFSLGFVGALVGLLGVACSSNGPVGAQDQTTDQGDAATSPVTSVTGNFGVATKTGNHLQATLHLSQVPGSAQQHVCVVVELPIDEDTWVTDIHATLTKGSHHLIVDRSQPGTALSSVPTPCAPTDASDATRLMIAQQPDTHVALPEGVAFKLAAHQPLFLQLHYINTTADPEDIAGSVDLTIADSTGEEPIEAKSIFTGSVNIHLSPRSPGVATAYVPVAPTAGAARNIFELTSHTHSLGVDSTIERVSSAKDPATTPIHESTDWAEPPLTPFSPPLQFTGKDGLRLTCKYDNTTDHAVHFGTTFQDEMCFMWIYYFDR